MKEVRRQDLIKEKNLYFCLKTSIFVPKFLADDRDTQRENG